MIPNLLYSSQDFASWRGLNDDEDYLKISKSKPSTRSESGYQKDIVRPVVKEKAIHLSRNIRQALPFKLQKSFGQSSSNDIDIDRTLKIENKDKINVINFLLILIVQIKGNIMHVH